MLPKYHHSSGQTGRVIKWGRQSGLLLSLQDSHPLVEAG